MISILKNLFDMLFNIWGWFTDTINTVFGELKFIILTLNSIREDCLGFIPVELQLLASIIFTIMVIRLCISLGGH